MGAVKNVLDYFYHNLPAEHSGWDVRLSLRRCTSDGMTGGAGSLV